jgi:type I restriction enzyme, S subunit
VIAAQARKLDALKTHKKGLMQQLFPREGETQPRLRFPEFQNAGEWEAKALKSFCKVGDTDHKMPSSVAEGIPYIMTGDFFGINGIDYEGAKKISAEDYEQLSKKIRPEFGDIVIARYASVGAVRYIETKLKVLVSYFCAIIKCNKSESSKYIYYIFQSDAIQSKIELEINASSQKNIGLASIKNLNIFLPTLQEQQKVADFFAALDALITAETKKLETLKTHKRGLMQQLFPAPEDVEA